MVKDLMIKVNINPRGGKASSRFPITIELLENSTVEELKNSIQSASRLNIHRQRLTTQDKKVLDDNDSSLKLIGVKDGDNLEIKDLGPQISWRTVFLTEYFGPLFIHPLFFFASKLIYGKTFEHSKMQKFALALVLAHYTKREIETVYVHRFSSATMPLTNLFKNSAHYWVLSGILLAAPLYGPWNSAARIAGSIRSTDNWIYGCTALWLFGEVSNAITHLNLRSLRPAGSKARAVPKGYGFGIVSCPNYLFEAVAWVAFTALTLDYAAAFFLAVSAGQMLTWAQKKHSRYRKEFKDYPRSRKAMIPLIF